MIITESEMTKEDCERINKELTRVRKEQGITLGHLIPRPASLISNTISTEDSEKQGMLIHHVTVAVPSTQIFELLRVLAAFTATPTATENVTP